MAARIDKRVSILLPASRKRQYVALAARNRIPLAAACELLMSMGYDHLLEESEALEASKQRARTVTRRGG
jgi:hypothetical protein